MKAHSARVWGLSRPIWVLVAGFCAFAEFAGAFVTNGRIAGWDDIGFITVFAVLGVVALINAMRLLRQSR